MPVNKNMSSGLLLTILIIVALLVVFGLIFWLKPKQLPAQPKVEAYLYPEYVSLGGNYVFTIPKSFSVYDRAIPGVQLLQTGDLKPKTLDEAYKTDAIAVLPIINLKDHNPEAFKKFVNEKYTPDLKKNLSSDVSVDFVKSQGWDAARIFVKKNGQIIRFAYLQNGQHPAQVIGKDETPALAKVAQTITDVENSDLKSEVAPLSQAISDTSLLIKSQQASELYKYMAPDFKAKVSVAELADALRAAEPYTKGAITVNGGGYDGKINEITFVMTFEPPAQNDSPASGVLYLDKINGHWQIKNLKLPSIVQPTAGEQKRQ